MEIKLLLKEKDRRILVNNFRTGTLLAQGGAPRGQSAYEQAVEGGYEGTKAEFEEALATGITTISESITDVNTVADNIADVNTVADNIADVHTVAENIEDVNTVADNVADVNTVAGISSDVTQVSSISNAVQTVSSHDSDVTLVSDNMASIMTTASNISDVNTVATISADVSTVAGIATDVSAVEDIKTDISAVAANATNINAVAGNESNINAVNSNKTNIDAVAGNATNINDVAGNEANINAVNANKTNIDTVAGNNTNITTVATNISNVNTAVTNMAAIIAAPTAAQNAATSATNAQKWAEGSDSDVSPLGGTHSSKGWANRAQELVESIGTVLHYKGSKATYADLPSSGNVIGDMWNVLADGSNYAWDGAAWDALSGVVDLSAYRTAAAQDVIDSGKQATITGAATSITSSNLTASKALVSDANGKVAVSSVTSTELGYVSGVTSAIQTQISNKQDTISDLSSIRSGAELGATAVQPSDLATVATSGSYNDLLDQPTIPTVNDATLTIQKNGTSVATFTANSSSNATANITVPTQASDIGAQETLVSGTNIKTVNNNSLLGSGNLDIDALPTQSGQSGKFLTTNGTSASWAAVDALPAQTGQSGKFLTTDGADASWANLPSDVEWATYGTTTYQQVADWDAANKIVLVKYSNDIFRLSKLLGGAAYFSNSGGSTYYSITVQAVTNIWAYSTVSLQSQIPAGTSGQVLTYTGTAGSVGSATLPTTMTGADGTNAGTSGLVPAPAATDNTKFLKGDGTWANVDSLPSQTGQSGKFLTTDGTSASWASPVAAIIREW